ncbi:hypothetical protein CMUS01_15495 [Colletotrichum musicola]|uniref:Uncharacterized protein n=1 Tax=Colletotrichum musicola TaxID=2175873 RepID=A0A8H6IWG5_9PEZI|nr:hypothetical protein CMUS01_15495 [Colletotrichum musicola]
MGSAEITDPGYGRGTSGQFCGGGEAEEGEGDGGETLKDGAGGSESIENRAGTHCQLLEKGPGIIRARALRKEKGFAY